MQGQAHCTVGFSILCSVQNMCIYIYIVESVACVYKCLFISEYISKNLAPLVMIDFNVE